MVASPASSQLSELSSHDFDEEGRGASPDHENGVDGDYGAMPPSKRRRTATAPRRSRHQQTSPVPQVPIAEDMTYDYSDVSSDSTRSVPGSPNMLKVFLEGMEDEETLGASQVRVCSWEGCNAGDLGNQDELVKHVHDVHVNAAKRAKFTCEWIDCKSGRKPQMSAYALRAHMRSHTKEKPFYCALPECDKSFTRSDALAKHMRTVHETESPRTADFYQKSKPQGATGSPAPLSPPPTAPSATSKPPRSLKLIINSDKSSNQSTPQLPVIPPEEDEGYAGSPPKSPLSPSSRDTLFGHLPPELDFTPEEAALPRNELFRLLRRQLHWAKEESVVLQQDIDNAEALRKETWLSRELVLENLMEAEFQSKDSKGLFQGAHRDALFGALGDPDAQVLEQDDEDLPLVLEGEEAKARKRGEQTIETTRQLVEQLRDDSVDARKLPLGREKQPWYRDEAEVEQRKASRAKRSEAERAMRREGAEVAASMEADDPSTMVDATMEDGGDDTEVDEGN